MCHSYWYKSKDGTLQTDPEKISECFADFYENGEPDPEPIEKKFEKLNLPKLSIDSINVLDTDINVDEIKKVVSSFPNNKAAGPDGFSIEFFKVFGSKISSLLLRKLNHSRPPGCRPPYMKPTFH